VDPRPAVELAVIIPTFEERENIPLILMRLTQALAGVRYEVIFVDDDSPDGTADVVRAIAGFDPKVRIIQRINRRGLTAACLEGLLSTAAPYLAMMDADLQHDEAILPDMLALLQTSDLDIVVGQGVCNAANAAPAKALRRLITRAICGCPIEDPLSGYFVMRRDFFMETVHRMSGIGSKILVDLLASCAYPPMLREIPYRLRERAHGKDKLGALAALEYFQLLVDKLVGNIIPPSFVLFALVGVAGLGVYFGLLTFALFRARASFDTGQITAAAAAMTFNFFLNNIITFRGARLRGKRLARGLAGFYAACSIGMWINLKMAHAAGALGAAWYTAGVLGLAAGSIWNYGVTQMFVWREGRKRLNREVPPPNWPGSDAVEDGDCRSLLALSQRVGTTAGVPLARALEKTER
jgi:dolichol-phosphate mannosyltransferase